jgi:hypothetical protein
MNNEGNHQLPSNKDLTWGGAAANWFLLGMLATFVQSQSGTSGGFAEFFGRLFGLLVMAAIPVAISYILSKNKIIFRLRLWLTVCAWIAAFFFVYGANS